MRKGLSRGDCCIRRPRREELLSVWTPDLFCSVLDKTSGKANSLYFAVETVSVPAVDVRPSGFLVRTPWLTVINTWILRSVLLGLLSYSGSLGLERSLPVTFHREEAASAPPLLKRNNVCHLRKWTQTSWDKQISQDLDFELRNCMAKTSILYKFHNLGISL